MISSTGRSGSETIYHFDIIVESLHGIQPKEGCTYSVKWKRGEKWTGRTEQFSGSPMGIVVLNHKISFNSTMQPKGKSRYHKKVIEFFVHEHSSKKGKAEKHRVAELKADLAETLNCTSKTVVLHDKFGGAGALMISVTSSPATGLLVPGQDFDLQTDVHATTVDGHSELDDPGTASIADDSEMGHTPKATPPPPREARPTLPPAPGPPAPAATTALAPTPAPVPVARVSPPPADAITQPVVQSAIAMDLERRLLDAEARVRVLEAERDRISEQKVSDRSSKQTKGIVEAQTSQMQVKVDEMRLQLEESQRAAEEAKLKAGQTRKEMEAKQLECECLEEQVSILSSENALLREEVESYKQQADDHTTQIQDLTEELQRHQTSHMHDLESLQARLTQQSKELNEVQQALKAANQIQTEIRLLDPLILWALPCFTNDGAPVAAVALLRWLKDWNAFATANNRKDCSNTFLENIVRALEHVIEAKKDDRCVLTYWVSSLWWLLSMLEAEYPLSQIKRHLQSLSVLQGIRQRLLQRQAARAARRGPGGPGATADRDVCFPVPKLLGASSGSPIIATPVDSRPSDVSEPALLRFCSDLLLCAADALSTLLQSTFIALDGVVDEAVFPTSPPGEVNPRGAYSIAEATQVLEGLFVDVIGNKLAGRIRDVIFHAVFSHIDALIFNHFVENKNLCTLSMALRLKAVVRELEKWQQERALTKAARSCLAHITQVANMLTLKKELLLEPQTRAGVCPALKVNQVATILGNYSADELDADGVSAEVVAQLDQESLLRGPAAVLLPTQHDTLALTAPGAPKDAPPYVTEWLPTIGDAARLDPHAVELPDCVCQCSSG